MPLRCSRLLNAARPADRRVGAVVGHRVRRADHIVRREVGQGHAVRRLEPGVGARHRDAPRPGRPDPDRPDQVDTEIAEPVELLVRHVGQGRRPPEVAGQLVEPDAQVHRVEDGVLLQLDAHRALAVPRNGAPVTANGGGT